MAFFFGPRRRRRRGMWMPSRGFYAPRRQRSSVRVGGCCLPIPLALVVGTAAGTRHAIRRGR